MSLSELYTLPIRLGWAGTVHVISGSLTGGADNLIFTPTNTNKCVFLVGQYFSETSATNVTYKSNSTTIVIPELAANQGVDDRIMNGVILGAAVGQSLYVNPSVDISSAVFHVIETQSLTF